MESSPFDQLAFQETLLSGAEKMGVIVRQDAAALMTTHASLLHEASLQQNLTGVAGAAKIAEKLFLDSLAILSVSSPVKAGHRWLDLGSGAGFPGLPIKSVALSLSLVLADSERRKAQFLREVCHALSLPDIAVRHGRAEQLAWEADLRESFDGVMAKAVAPMRVLLEYSLPFLRVGGILWAWKGPSVDLELRACGHALDRLGGEVIDRFTWTLPVCGHTTHLVVIAKRGSCEGYPRRAGVPSKRPL